MRKLTTVLLLLAGLCSLLEGCGTPEKTWTVFQKEWEARGEKFDYRVFVPAPIPSEKNFAHTPLLKPLLEEKWNSELTESKPTDPKKQRTATCWRAEGPTLRIHAGLEDPDDLILDLEQGLSRLSPTSSL